MKKHLSKLTLLFTILNIVTFVALRYIWSGIMNVVGGASWILFVPALFLVAAFVVDIINNYVSKHHAFWITSLALNVALAGLFLYMLSETLDYMRFFMRNFAQMLFVALFLYALVYITFYLLKKPNHHKVVVYVHTGLFLSSLLLGIAKTLDLGIMRFLTKPVVYAVEKEYQIVFETSRLGLGQVTVGNEIYYDSASGAIISSRKMHKVKVPMNVLDLHNEYTVSATHILYRGPYNGVSGRTISHKNTFKAIDTTDGLTFHVGTDFHDKKKSRVAAMTYEREKLDFVVMAGDISSFLETRKNITFINQSAREITEGKIPVIYNRGNHETKGIYRDELAHAVGTLHDNYYYTVVLGDAFIIVLDLAEDHNDDWWEFYGTAAYTKYRAEQIAWLQSVHDDVNGTYNWNSYAHRFVISHQPLSFINKDKNGLFLESEKTSLVSILNTMNIDASFAGHMHALYYLKDTPRGDLVVQEGFSKNHFAQGSGAFFPEFVTSKHALSQFAANSKTKEVYTSLRVEITSSSKRAYYVNSNHALVPIITPLTGETLTYINF